MDRLHNTMVKKMEEAEEILDQEAEQRRQESDVMPPTPVPARRSVRKPKFYQKVRSHF